MSDVSQFQLKVAAVGNHRGRPRKEPPLRQKESQRGTRLATSIAVSLETE